MAKSPSCTSCCHPCTTLPSILTSYSTSTTAGCWRPLLAQWMPPRPPVALKIAGWKTNLSPRPFGSISNLYLIDAVRQYGYPFFITISPYEWTFPFPSFLEDMWARYFKDVTDIPTIETLDIAHVLEQIACGYFTGGNCNRWRTRLYKPPRPIFQELGNIRLPLRVPETQDSSSAYANLGKGHFRHPCRSSSCLSALGKRTRRVYGRIQSKIGQVMPTHDARRHGGGCPVQASIKF